MLENYPTFFSFVLFFVSFLASYVYLDFKKTKRLAFENLKLLNQEILLERSKKKKQHKINTAIVNLQLKTDQQFTALKLNIANIDFTLAEIFH